MTLDLIPGRFFKMPMYPISWDDEDDLAVSQGYSSGLSLSEDKHNVYIEAAVPGVEPKDIEVTFDKGTLWIKGEVKEEEKEDKKFYRKSTSSFSYRVTVPGEIDNDKEPEAVCKNGVMKITFQKKPTSLPKKITVK